jgi:hypothetical protein
MARRVEANHHATLDEYADVAHLGGRVRELRDEAAKLVPKIGARRVWMLNSTARGGGVAELLPPLVALLRELGVDARLAGDGAARRPPSSPSPSACTTSSTGGATPGSALATGRSTTA